MNLILLALPLFGLFTPAQDPEGDLRFYRVHLKNGNFIDGELIKDAASEVVLRLKVGEMKIRRDQIDKVEFVKMKSTNTAAIYRPDPKKSEPAAAPASSPADPAKLPETNTPEEIKKKVDLILFKFKNAPGSDNKELPYQDIGALGEEAVVYLAARAPAFDLKTLDAIAIALINLKPTQKVIAVLETHLTSENSTARAFAMNVLCATGGDTAKLRYLRPLLKDPDSRVRITALSVLGSATDRDWVEPMLDCTTDKDKDVRSRAIRIAQILTDKHGMTDRLIAVMIANVVSSDAGVRLDAVNVLGAISPKENWNHLARCLNDADPAIRAAAASGLGRMGAAEATENILSAVEREQDVHVRTALAGTVQKLKLTKAIEPLIRWVAEPDADLQRVAGLALQYLTGENFGQDPEKWSAWWEKNKSK